MNIQIHKALLYLTAACWLSPSAELLALLIVPPSSADAVASDGLSIMTNGFITGPDGVLGRVVLDEAEALAIIRFPLSAYGSRTVDIRLPVAETLKPNAVSFESVQGTADMAWTQPDPTLLQIELPTLLSEAHTSATIRLSASDLHPDFFVRILSVLDSSPLLFLLFTSLVPLLVLSVFLLTFRLPRKLGKHDEVVEPPDGLTASELGTLWHGGLLSQDLSALFLSLAERGKFDIVLHSHQILLLRRGLGSTDRPEETTLLALLFPEGSRITYLDAEVKRLRQEIYSSSVGVLYAATYGKLLAAGYYLESPQRTHLRIKTVGILLQLLGAFGTGWSFFQLTGTRFAVFFLLSLIQYAVGILLYRTSSRSSLLSESGNRLFQQVSGFIAYLSSDRLIPNNASANSFFHYFPYAVAVGSAVRWRARFRKSTHSIPSWLSVEGEELRGNVRFSDHATSVAELLSLTLRKLKDPNVG